VIAGQSPESKYYNETGEGLPFFQGKADFGQLYPTNRVYCTSPKKLAENGDILLSVRAPVGPTNLARETIAIGRGLNAIRPFGGISTRFVLYYFKQIEPVFSGKGTGTTFSAVTVDDVKSLNFFLPPLAEQHRIVAKIDALFSRLDKGVEMLQTIRRQLRTYRQAVLKWAFEREDWKRKPFAEIATSRLGKMLDKQKNTGIYSLTFVT
jgi:type I restriction enzyme S subunit